MAAPREQPGVASPCVRQCCLDGADICLGCGRSLQEILDWHSADAQQKRAVLVRAAERMDQRRPPHRLR